MAEILDSRTVIARNLRALMEERNWDQQETARRSGVSQKTISNLLRMEGSPRVESVESVAKAFGLQGWQLIATTLDAGVPTLLTAWVQSSPEGREHILRVAEREAAYTAAG